MSKDKKNKKPQYNSQLEIKEFIFDFKSLDMNNPENLKEFLKYYGVPYRPFKEI